MANMVEAIPTLLHVAVFLFFAGLLDFLFSVSDIIAYIVLGAVIASTTVYIVITVIPTIRCQCPFSTPLSSICWRIIQTLGLLQYDDPQIGSRRIEGSMAEGREMLATQDSSGVYARDLRALQWTMESLNEDNRLDPFVEGISQILSSPSRESSPLMLPGMFGAMRGLLLDPDFDLFARIVKLLMTTLEPGMMGEAQRRKRAIACMNVINALVRLVNAAEPASVAWLNRGNQLVDLASALTALQSDSMQVIATTAASAKMAVVRRLRTEVVEAMNGYRELEWSHQTTTRVLDTLYRLGAIESILIVIPTVAPSRHFSAQYKDIIQVLRTLYIPECLRRISSHPRDLSPERQTQAITCLKSIFATASNVHPADSSNSFSSTTEALAELRHDNVLVIALIANCTAVRLAYHIQCDIIELACRRGVSPYSPEYDFIPVYRSLLDSLGVFESLNGTDVQWNIIGEFLGRGDEQLAAYLSQMSQDELKQLEEFQLCTTGRTTIKEFALSGKIVLSQGHTVLLIAFLKVIASSALPEDALEVTIETLRIITSNLTTRFSSRAAQALLVDLIGMIKCNFAADLAGQTIPEYTLGSRATHSDVTNYQGNYSQNLIVDVMRILFNVLGTIGDPEIINGAKIIVQTVVDDSQVSRAIRDAAANSLQKVGLRPINMFY